jgi:pyridoxal phosphate enzyme (YggS family)
MIRHHPVVHSVDSQRVLLAIAEESAAHGVETSVLLEVNISGDEAKTGFTPDALGKAVDWLQETPASGGLRVLGLMAMAGWGTDRAEARRQFDQTRQLRDRLQRDSGLSLPELSMGMSGDFPEAIAAGATMVRIGSRLFEGVIDRSSSDH